MAGKSSGDIPPFFSVMAPQGRPAPPSGIEGITEPIHALSLIAMGVPIFDNLDSQAVGREAAE